jgi:hypothetical protein
MPWDGIKRRSEDNGGESPETILARIDERLKNMNEKLLVHIVSFEEHRKEDEKNFAGIYKLVWIGCGILGAVQFIILAVKH